MLFQLAAAERWYGTVNLSIDAKLTIASFILINPFVSIQFQFKHYYGYIAKIYRLKLAFCPGKLKNLFV
jgi:hypothetical protein